MFFRSGEKAGLMGALPFAALGAVVALRRLPVFPKVKRVQAPAAPGFKPPSGWRPGRLRFCPQSGLVQRELCMLPVGSAPFGGLEVLHRTSKSAEVGL